MQGDSTQNHRLQNTSLEDQATIKTVAPKHVQPDVSVADWIQRYRSIRNQSEVLCRPLNEEDCNLQAMPEVSPPKWHLAHTTWFFERLWLKEYDSTYREFDPRYAQLFNSYYQTLGQPFPRERRGLLSRPTLDEVMTFRHEIDQRVEKLLSTFDRSGAALRRLQLGLHHEQQHQELLLTDIKYNFFANPLSPAYLTDPMPDRRSAKPAVHAVSWCEYPGGIVNIGVDSGSDSDFSFDNFCFGNFNFDNESPHHRVFLQPYALADRVANNGDYLDFMQDCGYQRPELWLADGWTKVRQQDWQAPLYWIANDSRHREAHQGYVHQGHAHQGHAHQGAVRREDWQIFTLYGLSPLHPAEPVCHLSYYEADAFARWAGARLPTEAEWENAASLHKFEGHFLDDGVLHPRAPCPDQSSPRQLFGDVWEWTASSYAPYPGFRSANGAIGEYNGKFMCNQMVLRGGSCVGEREHLRTTYRNFFYPWDRWQFSGVRLARDINC